MEGLRHPFMHHSSQQQVQIPLSQHCSCLWQSNGVTVQGLGESGAMEISRSVPARHHCAHASAAAPADPAVGLHGCWATTLATAAARHRYEGTA